MNRKRMKRVRLLLFVMLFALLFVGLSGCGAEATKLDQSERKQTEQQEDSWMDVDSVEEDEYFELEDAEDDSNDYSKYEEKDNYQTDPVPDGKPSPVEPQNAKVDKTKKKTCYLTVSCENVLGHMEDLTDGKESVVPRDGIIYGRRKVTFYDGESVFDVLKREMKNQKIHMESAFTPGYNSSYVSGIHNLYEGDCGDASGWMFCVNGWYPNYGCSRYAVQNGDEIQWNFTCDGGMDLGQSWMD